MSRLYFVIFSCCFFGLNLGHAQKTASPQAAALAFLRTHARDFGLTPADVADVLVTDIYATDHNQLTHVWVQQQYQGIPVFNGLFGLHVRPDGQVLTVGHRFVADLAGQVNSTLPALSAAQALDLAIATLGLENAARPRLKEKISPMHWLFEKGDFADEDIRVAACYQPLEDGTVRLSWALTIRQVGTADAWSIRVDAENGMVLRKVNLTAHCTFEEVHPAGPICEDETSKVLPFRGRGLETPTLHDDEGTFTVQKCPEPITLGNDSEADGVYRVFALPVESPSFGNRTLVTNPFDPTASPFGWHDINGAAGAEYNNTRGNNTHAYEDSDFNNQPPAAVNEVDGGPNRIFDFAFDPNAEPEANKLASVTNIFYVANMMHDIAYRAGFNEAAGNYQVNNYGKPGQANDPVFAEALDGSGTDNASFEPWPDGTPGRVQMYKWSGTLLVTVNQPLSLAGQYLAKAANNWGGAITTTPVTGEAVIVNDGVSNPPSLGCAPAVNSLQGKIAIIDRGSCTYGEKALFAQNKGAIGCIICNFENAPANMSVGAFGGSVTIPVVSMRNTDCDLLKQQALNGALNVSLVRPVSTGPSFLDGALDNATIAHEYAHGISNRLSGGPSTVDCLSNPEQMGEGWSDFFGLAVTAKPSDTGGKIRSVGSFLYREPNDGGGLRRFPYSTDMSISPLTFANVAHNVKIHALGEVWTNMLWDLYWAMVEQYGFSPDLFNGDAGNNRAIRLVIDGLKLQPCNPGFVDARNAILLADQQGFGGANQCLIWNVFARRGLGEGASQGSPSSAADGKANFDPPVACQQELTIKKAATPNINPGQNIQFTLTVRNGQSSALTNVAVTDELPAGLTLVAGSASNSGNFQNGKMNWLIANLPAGESIDLTYTAKSDPQKGSVRQHFDDFEGDVSSWLSYDLTGAIGGTFSLQSDKTYSGSKAWLGPDPTNATDYVLATDVPQTVSGVHPALRFWHSYGTDPGFDGGFIEVSNNNGGAWQRISQDKFIRNRYTGGIDYFTLAIPYLDAFWGQQPDFQATYIDLSAFAGQQLLVRFHFGSNGSIGNSGWYIDDLEWMDLFRYDGVACASANGAAQACAKANEGGTIVSSNLMIPTQNLTNHLQLRVQPNPVSDRLFVSANQDMVDDVQVSLYSTDGKLFQTLRTNNLRAGVPLQINLSEIPTGIYFLKMEGENGRGMEKVVIVR